MIRYQTIPNILSVVDTEHQTSSVFGWELYSQPSKNCSITPTPIMILSQFIVSLKTQKTNILRKDNIPERDYQGGNANVGPWQT